jgi:Pentapeptide repeats (8 copies)
MEQQYQPTEYGFWSKVMLVPRLFWESFKRPATGFTLVKRGDDVTVVQSGEHLMGKDLRGVYLRKAYLRDTRLEGAQLQGANLIGANLQGASLMAARMQGATLEEADLRNAVFIEADLSEANLRYANLRGAHLEDCILRDADLWDANVEEYELERARDSKGIHRRDGRKADYRKGEAPKIEHRAIPEWAEGLYYNKGLFSEALIYHDGEALYFEHRGKDSGVVRLSFEMLETLKEIVEEQQKADRGGIPGRRRR